ncbi:MAG: hypothetical protein GX050_00695, partial [Firmicutes bacterium]|nr:hypothetical protein [Bacillota bacterium]
GNMIVGCQVFGKRAGRAAAELSKNQRKTPAPDASSLETVRKIGDPQGKYLPTQIKAQIQHLMSTHYLIVKNELGLTKLIQGIEELTKQTTADGFALHSPADLWHALECRNMLQTALVMAKAALSRKESRGSHFRDDVTESKPEFERMISFQLRGHELKQKTIKS